MASFTSSRPSAPAGSVALALHAFAQQFAITAHRFGLFPRPPLRGLLVTAAQLHLSKHPFALHFLLQGAERLIDIVVANEDLHGGYSPWPVMFLARRGCDPP